MDKIYHINGSALKVNFRLNMIRIKANYALRGAIGQSWTNIEKLSAAILADYQTVYGRPLKIKFDSLVVEILGHAYAYKILLSIRKISESGLFRKLSFRACSIDCGDEQRDQNRWFWDLLGYIKPVIFLFR